MHQNNKFKGISGVFLENVIIFIGIIFPVVLILPKTEILLNSSPSSIGFAELVVFFSHIIIGLSCYFIFLLFIRLKSLKIILSFSLLYLIIVDINIFLYQKSWLIISLLIVRFIQLYLLSLLYNSNFRKSRFLIDIVIILILAGWFFVIKEF